MKYTTYKGKFRYTPGVNAYDVTVRKPFNWLWLLLLLLLLPLFIRCEREVVVEVLDEKGTPVENVDISLAYDARFLYNDGFFTTVPVKAGGRTGAGGTVRIDKLPCSVWSYIFFTETKMTVAAVPPPPYEAAMSEERFHTTGRVLFTLKTAPADIPVRVTDAMTGRPLAGAEVVATVNGSGVGVFATDAGGVAMIPGIHPTDVVSLAGRKEGYETNEYSIRRVKGSDLDSDPVKEIPLKRVYECDDDVEYNSEAKPLIVIENIDMHKDKGRFVLTVFTLNQPDRFVVKDAEGRELLDTGLVSTGNSSRDYTVEFSTRHITIEAHADPGGNPETSIWTIRPHCPE